MRNNVTVHDEILFLITQDVYCTILSVKSSDDKLFKVCKLNQIQDRRTIDRRFQNLPITQMINNIGNLFVSEGLIGNDSVSVDSSMLKVDCPVWHKLNMKNNHLSISGIDTDANGDFSKSKVGRVFWYKRHMSCSTGKLIVPLSAEITTANIHDGKIFEMLVKPLVGLFQNVLCDPAYDDKALYQFSEKKNLRWITPIKQYIIQQYINNITTNFQSFQSVE